jgi:hypothetical protein
MSATSVMSVMSVLPTLIFRDVLDQSDVQMPTKALKGQFHVVFLPIFFHQATCNGLNDFRILRKIQGVIRIRKLLPRLFIIGKSVRILQARNFCSRWTTSY